MGDIRNGGAVMRPSTGATVRWTPIEAVADEYEAAVAMAAKGYRCLGIIGNGAHLLRSGGHTPWCSEGYGGRACKLGRVYAIDLELPDPSGTFLAWLRARLQAGYYGWIFYLNFRGKQITRRDGFRGTYSSSDHHLHLSGLAGHESDNSSILRDWDTARSRPAQTITPSTTGDDMAQVPQEQWAGVNAAVGDLHRTLIQGKGDVAQNAQIRRDMGYIVGLIQAGNAADKARDDAALAAINGLAAGQNTGQILSAIDAARISAERAAEQAVHVALDRLLGPAAG